MLYLSLGSNLGNRRENIGTAVRLVGERIGKVTAESAVIETEPWGYVSDHPFMNQVIAVETDMEPNDILTQTQSIEREMGRRKKSTDGHYSDRCIDIDLLLYGDRIVRTDRLRLPHPLMHLRRFVLEPLAEIAPDAIHPELQKSIGELLETLSAETV